MDLETIYYIGQTVAVVAIILSLIFVGVQVRQNTAQAKADAAEAAHRSFLDWYYSQTPEMAAVFVKANEDFDGLSAEDRLVTFMIAMPILMNLQEAHIKWVEGTLAEERWRFWDEFATIILVPPIVEKIWQARRMMFSDAFQRYFDLKIEYRGNVPASAVSLPVPPKQGDAPSRETPLNEELPKKAGDT